MKQHVTLSEETLTKLTILVNRIDNEESSDDPNVDIVVDDMYQILDIVRTLVS